MKVEVDIKGVQGVLEALQKLPPELVSRRGGVALKALRKGARLIRDEAAGNFRMRTMQPGKTGMNYPTGFTAKHIVVRRRNLNRIKGERVVVTVRSVPHPNGHKFRNGRTIRSNDIAFIMEHGSENQPAEPWLRPAFAARAEEAIRKVESELVSLTDKIVKKLAAQNAGKK